MSHVDPARRAPVAVTGRFQPFHRDHLELVHHAAGLSDTVIVGITNPDPRSQKADRASAHRHTEAANPFTYFERQRIVRRALAASGLQPDRFCVVPFPLDEPSLWPHYIPLDAVQLVRSFSPWEDKKIDLLRAGGYAVHALRGDGASRISASDVRRAIAHAEPWRHWLPKGAVEVLDAMGDEALAARCGADRVT